MHFYFVTIVLLFLFLVQQKKKDKAEKYQMEQAKRIKHEEKIRRRILWEKNQLLHQVKSTIESTYYIPIFN